MFSSRNENDHLVQRAGVVRMYKVRAVSNGRHEDRFVLRRGVVVRRVRQSPPVVVTAGYHSVDQMTRHAHATVLGVDYQRKRGVRVI